MVKKFKNRVAVITGSSDGIGYASALQLASEGAQVVLNGRNEEKLKHAVERISQKTGILPLSVQGDITDSAVIKKLVSETIHHFSKIDILINNTGGGSEFRWIGDIVDTDWQRILDFNLSSTFFLIREIVPHMIHQQYGRIVNVSSVAGRNKGRLSGPHYAAAKAGVLGLTRHLAHDLADKGINVNAVAPGIVMTDRAMKKWDSRSQEDKDLMMSNIPMKRFASPDEIASAIVFLASEEASYITGVSLDVNGGSFMC